MRLLPFVVFCSSDSGTIYYEKIFNYFLRGKLKMKASSCDYQPHLILTFAHKPQGGTRGLPPPCVRACFRVKSIPALTAPGLNLFLLCVQIYPCSGFKTIHATGSNLRIHPVQFYPCSVFKSIPAPGSNLSLLQVQIFPCSGLISIPLGSNLSLLRVQINPIPWLKYISSSSSNLSLLRVKINSYSMVSN